MEVLLTPRYEIQIPNPTPIMILPSDYNLFFGPYNYNYLFDGDAGSPMETLIADDSPMPQSFTLDFHVPRTFSNLKYYMVPLYSGVYEFNHSSPEKWEIWGSNELNDDWDAWTKIMDCVAVKPSGSPLGITTPADTEASRAGLDFEFPEGTPPYRYIRWKTTKTFGDVNAVTMSELTFWGYQDDND